MRGPIIFCLIILGVGSLVVTCTIEGSRINDEYAAKCQEVCKPYEPDLRYVSRSGCACDTRTIFKEVK